MTKVTCMRCGAEIEEGEEVSKLVGDEVAELCENCYDDLH